VRCINGWELPRCTDQKRRKNVLAFQRKNSARRKRQRRTAELKRKKRNRRVVLLGDTNAHERMANSFSWLEKRKFGVEDREIEILPEAFQPPVPPPPMVYCPALSRDPKQGLPFPHFEQTRQKFSPSEHHIRLGTRLRVAGDGGKTPHGGGLKKEQQQTGDCGSSQCWRRGGRKAAPCTPGNI